MRRSRSSAFEIGSANVFADIGLPDPEVAFAKAEVARTIISSIQERRLTQNRAAELLGIDQPRVSSLVRGRLSIFSLETLVRYAVGSVILDDQAVSNFERVLEQEERG